MWPWTRYRKAADAAAAEAAAALNAKHAAETRRQTAERQAARARAITATLRREIDKNGWTELLQHAWGGRP